jgi:hypothetical protein
LMRIVKYVGALLVVGLLWAVVSAVLRAMGFGQSAIVVVGFLALFILGPVLFGLASGGGTATTADATTSPSPVPVPSARAGKTDLSGPDGIAAAVNATHEAAKALEDVGMTEHARTLRAGAAQAQASLQGDIDPGGYSGDYRLLKKRTGAGGIVFWVRDASAADNPSVLLQMLVAEAANVPNEFRQRFLQGNTVPVRQTFRCPRGGYELHVDFHR